MSSNTLKNAHTSINNLDTHNRSFKSLFTTNITVELQPSRELALSSIATEYKENKSYLQNHNHNNNSYLIYLNLHI